MIRLILAVALVVLLALLFIAASPAQKDEDSDDYTHHRVECGARSDIFRTSNSSVSVTSRTTCDRLTQALSIDGVIQQEFIGVDVVNVVDTFGDSCLVCRNLTVYGESYGLGTGRYSVSARHRMTVHGDDASYTSYDCCVNLP